MTGIEAEVAALREEIEEYGASMFEGTRGPSLADLMARLDRIAAQVPKRATSDGKWIWLHDCGALYPCPEVPSWCLECSYRGTDGWQPLYVLGEVAS